MPGAFITGCAGTALEPEEIAFFREADPFGFILFARNVEAPGQVRALCASLKDTVGRDAPILINQEGGRVARLQPPYWRAWGPAIEERDLFGRYAAISAELADLGISSNCVPLADIARPDTHPILANRCYGSDVESVIAGARAVADATARAGLWPILKHIPGHGRGTLDSHLELPRVTASLADLETSDFAPFRALNDLPFAMTAHIVYDALDPERPATISPTVISYIRETLGFQGCLMSDDISMQALTGDVAERSRLALAAGCDLVLHCNGDLAEMRAVAEASGRLAGATAKRAEAAIAWRQRTGEPVNG